MASPASTRQKAYLVSLALLFGGVWLGHPQEKEEIQALQWEQWSPGYERELLDQGRAVYISQNTLAAKGGDPINYQSKRGAFEPNRL